MFGPRLTETARVTLKNELDRELSCPVFRNRQRASGLRQNDPSVGHSNIPQWHRHENRPSGGHPKEPPKAMSGETSKSPVSYSTVPSSNTTSTAAASSGTLYGFFCSNCGEVIPNGNRLYYCKICYDGKFIICEPCKDEDLYSGGEQEQEQEHQLIRCHIEDGKIYIETEDLNKPPLPLDIAPSRTDMLSPIAVRGIIALCDNCGRSIPSEHYHFHCDDCDGDAFDLYQNCVDKGVVCKGADKGHPLMARFIRGKVYYPKEPSATTPSLADFTSIAGSNLQQSNIAIPESKKRKLSEASRDSGHQHIISVSEFVLLWKYFTEFPLLDGQVVLKKVKNDVGWLKEVYDRKNDVLSDNEAIWIYGGDMSLIGNIQDDDGGSHQLRVSKLNDWLGGKRTIIRSLIPHISSFVRQDYSEVIEEVTQIYRRRSILTEDEAFFKVTESVCWLLDQLFIYYGETISQGEVIEFLRGPVNRLN